MYVCKWTEELQGMIDYLALAWQNNFFPRILITRGMTFKFEYLAEFEFIFKNNLGAWSGAQELAFDEKKRMSKISCKCTVPLIHFSSLSVSSDMYSMYNISTNYLYSRTCLQNVSFLMVSVSCISSYLYVRICSLKGYIFINKLYQLYLMMELKRMCNAAMSYHKLYIPIICWHHFMAWHFKTKNKT
jgi:hypothetical protein